MQSGEGRTRLPVHLLRVNDATRRSRQTRFTALLHHVDVEALGWAFWRLRRSAPAGVDAMTVKEYAEGLQARLRDRVHRGRYRPQPVLRAYIAKADGGRRALGIVALEDKTVQGAVAEVLSAVYEADFLDCSYGFRPGRSAHQALRAVHTAIMSERVSWILDADIRKFLDHEWMMRMLAHRIADPRVLRLVRQWLGAGVSPLLANIYVHYTLDLWVRQCQRRYARGRMNAAGALCR